MTFGRILNRGKFERVFRCEKCGYVSRPFGTKDKVDHSRLMTTHDEMESHFTKKHPRVERFIEHYSVKFIEKSRSRKRRGG